MPAEAVVVGRVLPYKTTKIVLRKTGVFAPVFFVIHYLENTFIGRMDGSVRQFLPVLAEFPVMAEPVTLYDRV